MAGKKGKSGRPKGSLAKRTKALRAIADEALVSGRSPLDIMLDNMRFFHEQAEVLRDRVEECVRKKSEEAIFALKRLQDARLSAQSCAADAAPYVHSRFATMTVKGDKGSPLRVFSLTMSAEEAAQLYSERTKQIELAPAAAPEPVEDDAGTK